MEKDNLPLEEQLKIAGAGYTFDIKKHRSLIAILASEKLDWDKFIKSAFDDRIAPALYYNFRKLGLLNLLPLRIQEILFGRYSASLQNNLAIEIIMGQVLRDVAQEAEIMALKGVVFAQTVYEDRGMREFSDIDLLIKRKDVFWVDRVLTEKWGLRCNTACPASRTYQADGKSRYALPVPIDIIWEINPIDRFAFATGWRTDTAWKNSRPLIIYGQAIKTLSPEDTVLYQIYHLAFHHRFCGLLWYVDLLKIIQKEKKLDWDKLIFQARAYGLSGVTYKILLFVKDTLGASISNKHLEALKLNVSRLSLPHLVKLKLGDEKLNETNLKAELWLARLFDRPYQSIKVIYRLLFPSRKWLEANFGKNANIYNWFLYLGWSKGPLFLPDNTETKARVLHIVTRFGPGGVTEALVSLSKHADRKKFECIFLAGLEEDIRFDKSAYAISQSMNLTVIPQLRREINPWQDLVAFLRIYLFIKRNKFNIVHTHSSKAGVLGRIAAWIAGVPVIIHQPHGHVFKGMFGPRVSGAFIFIERLLSRITDKIIVLTEIGKQEHVQCGVAKADKFTVIPHGIDLARFVKNGYDLEEAKRRLNISGAYPVLGTVAHLVERKGYSYFIKAASRVKSCFPQTKVLIVGEGHLLSRLEGEAVKLGLKEDCLFLGARQDVEKIYPLLDIFMLASVNEGMGRVLIEAMSCEKPVVATNVMGIPEIVKDGVTGLLVPPANAEALAEAAIYLLGHKEKLTEMGKAGKERVCSSAYFSEKNMVRAIEGLYAEKLPARFK